MLRTMQLDGTMTNEGYDPVKANSNGVAVKEKPAVAEAYFVSFQEDVAQTLKTDPTYWSEARA